MPRRQGAKALAAAQQHLQLSSTSRSIPPPPRLACPRQLPCCTPTPPSYPPTPPVQAVPVVQPPEVHLRAGQRGGQPRRRHRTSASCGSGLAGSHRGRSSSSNSGGGSSAARGRPPQAKGRVGGLEQLLLPLPLVKLLRGAPVGWGGGGHSSSSRCDVYCHVLLTKVGDSCGHVLMKGGDVYRQTQGGQRLRWARLRGRQRTAGAENKR